MLTSYYQAYEQGSLLTSQNPMQLIIALYEGGIGAVEEAARCLEAGDIMGRSKAVTKAQGIVAELQLSLNRDTAETRKVSESLDQLYGYIQKRLLEAHCRQIGEPFAEVEKLLRTMLEGWYTVARKEGSATRAEQSSEELAPPPVVAGADDVLRISYGGYYREPMESCARLAFSF